MRWRFKSLEKGGGASGDVISGGRRDERSTIGPQKANILKEVGKWDTWERF